MTILGSLSRFPLAQLPTPVEELRSLSRVLNGPSVYCKRDDQTGLAFGGNKTRKLEYLIAEAIKQGATTVITAGAAQSNHCRQTAAAAARAGLKCELVLGGTQPDIPDGNLLLDDLLGAKFHWTVRERRGERMEEIAESIRKQGEVPYLIPYGGSNAVGATGYVQAMVELSDQLAGLRIDFDRIIVASSSGGTQAGLVVGSRMTGFRGKITGISIDKGEREEIPYERELTNLSNDISKWIGFEHTFSEQDFDVCYDYLGEGYGVVGPVEREAIRLVARQEGILLDPVYTGRAMGALIEMIRRQEIPKNENVLFWHTGGGPALFAYARDLRSGQV